MPRAGYSNPTSLRTAARLGKLKTVTFSPHARPTTQAGLINYLATLHPGNDKRGQPKGQRAGEAGE